MKTTMYKSKRDEIRAESREYLLNRGSFKYSTERSAHHFVQLVDDIDTLESENERLREEYRELESYVEKVLLKTSAIKIIKIKEPMPQCFNCGYIKKEFETDRVGAQAALARVKEIVSEIKGNYPEDIFEPLKKEDIMPSRDRISAHMARHICDRILEELK